MANIYINRFYTQKFGQNEYKYTIITSGYQFYNTNLNKLVIAPFDGLCSADRYPIETIHDLERRRDG